MVDKYGVGDDPYCYPGTDILINKLDIKDDTKLAEAEKVLSDLSLEDIEYAPPPYDLKYFKNIHYQLFSDVYEWAGDIPTGTAPNSESCCSHFRAQTTKPSEGCW